MRKPVVITTPMPTFDEVAKEYGLSKKRQKAILEISGRIGAGRDRDENGNHSVSRTKGYVLAKKRSTK